MRAFGSWTTNSIRPRTCSSSLRERVLFDAEEADGELLGHVDVHADELAAVVLEVPRRVRRAGADDHPAPVEHPLQQAVVDAVRRPDTPRGEPGADGARECRSRAHQPASTGHTLLYELRPCCASITWRTSVQPVSSDPANPGNVSARRRQGRFDDRQTSVRSRLIEVSRSQRMRLRLGLRHPTSASNGVKRGGKLTSPPTPSPLRWRGAAGKALSMVDSVLATAPLLLRGEGVGGEVSRYTFASACSRSAIRSPTVSNPTERRT